MAELPNKWGISNAEYEQLIAGRAAPTWQEAGGVSTVIAAGNDVRPLAEDAKLALGDSAWLYGLHDPHIDVSQYPSGDYVFGGTGRRGWIFKVMLVTDPDYTQFEAWSKAGFGTICRIDYNWAGAEGSIPQADKHQQFADAVAAKVKRMPGIRFLCVGNEPNLVGWGRRQGLPLITPAEWAACFNLVYKAVKAVAPHVLVAPGALGPYAAEYISYGRTPEQWFKEAEALIEQRDWLCIHGYRWPYGDKFADAPMQGYHLDFLTVADQIGWVDESRKSLPILITECNQKGDAPWDDAENNYIPTIYKWVNDWNLTPFNPQIHAVCLYRLSRDDQWHLPPAQVRQLQKTVALNDYRRRVPNWVKQRKSIVYLPWLSQNEKGAYMYSADCGQSCVLMRLRSLGLARDKTIDQLAQQVGQNYTSAVELVQLFSLYGVSANYGYGVLEFGDIALIKHPLVGMHWVVYVKEIGDEVVYHDPWPQTYKGFATRAKKSDFANWRAEGYNLYVRADSGYSGEVVEHCVVQGNYQNVRVRNTPEFAANNVLGVLDVGTPIDVIVRDDQWTLISLDHLHQTVITDQTAGYMYAPLVKC